MKAGSQFEKLSAELFSALKSNLQFESVEHNVLLPGPDGPRQIDVLLKGRVGPLEIITIVECKDHNSIVPVGEIDALYSKLQDVRAQKAVMVARKGFSKTAQKKATRLGITLCTAQEAKHAKWPIREQIPYVLDELSCENIELSFQLTATQNTKLHFPREISGVPLGKIVADYWDKNEIEINSSHATHSFTPALESPAWIWLGEDRSIKQPITNLLIGLSLRRLFYFGYFNDLGSAKCLDFLDTKIKHVVFNTDELGSYRAKLARYENRENLPKVEGIMNIRVKLLLNPTTTFNGGNLRAQKLAPSATRHEVGPPGIARRT